MDEVARPCSAQCLAAVTSGAGQYHAHQSVAAPPHTTQQRPALPTRTTPHHPAQHPQWEVVCLLVCLTGLVVFQYPEMAFRSGTGVRQPLRRGFTARQAAAVPSAVPTVLWTGCNSKGWFHLLSSYFWCKFSTNIGPPPVGGLSMIYKNGFKTA